MKIYYHNDLDGLTSAAIFNLYVSEHNKDKVEKLVYIPYNYGDKIVKPKKDEYIWLLDCSFTEKEMSGILKYTKNVSIIDHHKTTKFKSYLLNMKVCYVNTDCAACELTWKYFFDTELPLFVRNVADWDMWRFKEKNTEEIQLIASSRYKDPRDERLKVLLTEELVAWETIYDELVHSGIIIKEFVKQKTYGTIKKLGFDSIIKWKEKNKFKSTNCFVVNANTGFSHKYLKDFADIVVIMQYNGENWIYSIYSETIDVSKIAQYYGGGGHKGAAGFTNKDCLFIKEK